MAFGRKIYNDKKKEKKSKPSKHGVDNSAFEYFYCANRANPYHQCSDICRTLSINGGEGVPPPYVVQQIKDGKEQLRLDFECINSSNPYHTCTPACRSLAVNSHSKNEERTTEVIQHKMKSLELNTEPHVIERIFDFPCVNRSNRFHECTEACRNLPANRALAPPPYSAPISSYSQPGAGQVYGVPSAVNGGLTSVYDPYFRQQQSQPVAPGTPVTAVPEYLNAAYPPEANYPTY